VRPVSRIPAATLLPKARKPKVIVAMPAPKNTSSAVPISSAQYRRAILASIVTEPSSGPEAPKRGLVRPEPGSTSSERASASVVDDLSAMSHPQFAWSGVFDYLYAHRQ
jgi:hypothetical protein